jgi:pSer/pThr/pTyr-binding forkhead associated (FHA) protein
LLVRDLNSTNGTFINGEKISEAVLKPGQTLRFGQVELKIDEGGVVPVPAAPAPVSASATPPAPAAPAAPVAKKQVEATMVIPRGVSLTDLEQSGAHPSGFDTSRSFSKKTNKVNRYFIIAGIIVGALIVGLIIFALKQAGSSH